MPALPRRTEFVALMAMLFATIAFSIDAMLPALPQIAQALSPDEPNSAQLIITSFVLGMGLGTFFTGPLSDSFGRKPVLLAGAALYVVGAIVGGRAQSLEVLLASRVVMGLGAAGPRVVALAIIRDLYAGRGMAKIMSFVMIVFTLVPALAPSLGAVIIALAGWRAVFLAFVLFALIASLWFALRLPETLPLPDRRPFRARALWSAVQDMFRHPVVRLSMMVQSLCFAMLFGVLSTTQQIFEATFDRAATFPLWFGGIALVSSSASFLNAALVERLGMQVLVSAMLTAQVGLSAGMVLITLFWPVPPVYFAAFVVWQASVFFQAGMTIGNLNAIAMEPMGHIAGMAASIIGAVATVIGVVIGAPVGLAFDGTPLPLALGMFVMSGAALLLMRKMRRIAVLLV
ncbi:multidrug effflux MFS transporter [Thalassococcus sp. BH17M4-6]|uniref:multidrug effflux MFS transporter n=1 Tax=Thalassococcus sp. BH17M4-6 TaxID=3413148 RepID=UPI003BC4C87D